MKTKERTRGECVFR
jgi:hypothetical protein